MTKEEEKQYWRRIIREIQAAGYSVSRLSDMLGVDERLIWSWREGHRPTGLVAVKLYELRRTIILRGLTIIQPSGMTGASALS